MLKYLIFVIGLSSVYSEEAFDYTGYHLIRITPKNNEQVNILAEWQHQQDVGFSLFQTYYRFY
jgi:hypothetical protein